jgi:hypothetical protein
VTEGVTLLPTRQSLFVTICEQIDIDGGWYDYDISETEFDLLDALDGDPACQLHYPKQVCRADHMDPMKQYEAFEWLPF